MDGGSPRKMSRVMRFGVVASALAATMSGCGESNGLYPVYGQVKYKGEPAAGATVSFYPRNAVGPQGQIPQAEVGVGRFVPAGLGDLALGVICSRRPPSLTHRLLSLPAYQG